MPGDIRSFFGAAAPKKPAAEPKADATKSDVVMVAVSYTHLTLPTILRV